MGCGSGAASAPHGSRRDHRSPHRRARIEGGGRLFDIDLILNRTLVYIPLMAILSGLYAGSVALFQRVFVALTGDTSDVAIVVTTLVLASAFTPIRKALEGLVERRWKPEPTAAAPVPTREQDASIEGDEVPMPRVVRDAAPLDRGIVDRVAKLEARLVALERSCT